MAKPNFENMINVKDKFSVLTETLNIFDLSFLVSGSAMLGLCFYAFPVMRHFFIHGDQLFLSILLCIWFSYVLGLISRAIGKNIAKVFYRKEKFVRETKEKNVYDFFFPKIFSVEFNWCPKLLQSEKTELAYSYMWMKLDTSTNADCRSRFLYVSRIWVLHAIYEGLIPPIIFLSVIVLCNGDLCRLSYVAFGGYLEYVAIPLVVALDVIVIALLAREAHHCNETLRQEVFVAYYDFFVKRKNSSYEKKHLHIVPR